MALACLYWAASLVALVVVVVVLEDPPPELLEPPLELEPPPPPELAAKPTPTGAASPRPRARADTSRTRCDIRIANLLVISPERRCYARSFAMNIRSDRLFLARRQGGGPVKSL